MTRLLAYFSPVRSTVAAYSVWPIFYFLNAIWYDQATISSLHPYFHERNLRNTCL